MTSARVATAVSRAADIPNDNAMRFFMVISRKCFE
jgi:hypothetical protein